jgi:hypothetical protein
MGNLKILSRRIRVRHARHSQLPESFPLSVASRSIHSIALNVASNGAGKFPELRGEFCRYDVSFDDLAQPWGTSRSTVGRIYSVVPWRGWVLKIDAKSGAITPIACGLRSPNDLGYDAHGHLLVSDSERPHDGFHRTWIGRSLADC